MMNDYEILIGKLDAFIRKYYKNQLIRGALIGLSALIAVFIVLSFLEYLGWFGTTTRAVLFYAWMIVNVVVLVRYLFIPLAKLYKLGETISTQEAARIIGRHFPEVSDKLLNTLQLAKMRHANTASLTLLEASIAQKTHEMKPIPFQSAVDYSINKKYLKYALPPALLLLIILLVSPTTITGPADRLVHHTQFFEKEMPFRFIIKNDHLQTIQNEDYLLEIEIAGKEIPAVVSLEAGSNRYPLNKKNTIRFQHLFRHPQSDITFRLSADGFVSKPYTIQVWPKPIIVDFEVALDYPAYTQKKDEILANTGDLMLPTGTTVQWKFYTKDTRTVMVHLNDDVVQLEPQRRNTFEFKRRFLSQAGYTIKTTNQYLTNQDSLSYMVNVVPDAYPSILVKEYGDSIYQQQFYFKGMVKDDYGFSKLLFHTVWLNNENGQGKTIISPIEIASGQLQQQFFHHTDLGGLDIQPGDRVEYFFEVWDNDGVNGPKSSRSDKKIFRAPTAREIKNNMEKASDQMKQEMETMIQDARALQEKADNLTHKLLEKKKLGWQEKKQIEDLLKEQKQLQDNLHKLNQQYKQNNQQAEPFEKPTPEMLEKQRQLEELFEQIMTDEMKQLYSELQDMLEKLNKDDIRQKLEDIKLSNEDIEKELDRNLELLKQFEFEQKLEETIQQLDKLKELQEALQKKTTEQEVPSSTLKQEQDKLNKDFDDLRKDIEKLGQQNNHLENPNDLPETKDQEEAIQEDLQQSSENLGQNKQKKAAESQKNASQKIQELSNQLSLMQQKMQQDNTAEDAEALREILDNLVKISFNQEELMNKLDKTSPQDPQYVQIIRDQKKINDDMQIIEDSLLALSKRQIAIQSYINREVNKINQSLDQTVERLLEMNTIGYTNPGNKGKALTSQQYAMTSMNNLALMLSESLQSMMQQMAMQMQGKPGQCKGNCPGSKPGAGGQKPSMKSMRQMQEALNKQLESLKQGVEKGGQKPGGTGGMSEQLARMAAQQSAIRQRMRALSDELKKTGQGTGNLGKIMEEMDQTETDLVNRIITQETLKRQQNILTKLLEHEKAELEREKEEKRESVEQKNELFRNNIEFIEYNKLELKEEELLQTVPPSFKKFYKDKVNEYFYNFEQH